MEITSRQEQARPRVRLSGIIAPLTALGFPSALAGYLPSRHWLVDLPACFPVQAGAALLLGSIVLFAARRQWLGLIWLLGALAAIATVLPNWVTASNVQQSTGEPLSLLSINLSRGSEKNAASALRRIRSAQADVVFLSEVTPAWLRALGPRLSDYPHRHVQPDPGYYGLALFSKYPMQAETTALAVSWAPAVRAIIKTSSGPIGLLGVHTPRPGSGDRCMLRDAALAAIPGALIGMPDRHIVVGDFNATPWTQSFCELLDTASLHHATGDSFRPTWPAQYPWPFRIPIDHVLTGGGITADHVVVGAPFGSDHAPLFVRLRL